MKVDSRVTVRVDRREAFLVGLVALAAAILSLAPGAARGADPGGSGPTAGPVVKLEKVPGSSVPRVILSARAAERLGIALGKVDEQAVVRKLMVSGVIVTPLETPPSPRPAGGGFGGFERAAPVSGGFGGFGGVVAAAPKPVAARAVPSAAGGVWVHMMLSPGEWDRLAKDRPARLLPLATRDNLAKEVLARPLGMEPLEDTKRSMLSLYYEVPGKDHGLTMNNRMRVELQLAGSDEKQKVVPYGAVYYDAKGAPWVYVNGKPLTFERQRIGVERVVGNLAVLSEGPAVGTSVVTVGAAMLYGAEIFKK